MGYNTIGWMSVLWTILLRMEFKMITDVVVTVAVLLFIWCLSFISVMFLLLSDADYKTKNSCILKTKNSYSIMVLGVIVFVLFLYCGYMLL